MVRKDVQAEIDSTIDKLVENAEGKMDIPLQEGLITKLLAMNDLITLPKKQKSKIKIKVCKKQSSKFMNRVGKNFGMPKRKKMPYARSRKKFLKTN